MRRGVAGTGPALGSGAVDAQFWALVCEDEEWLRAEFDAIVSAPAEAGRRPVRRPAIGAADHPGRQRFRPLEADNPAVVLAGQPGRAGEGNDHLRGGSTRTRQQVRELIVRDPWQNKEPGTRG